MRSRRRSRFACPARLCRPDRRRRSGARWVRPRCRRYPHGAGLDTADPGARSKWPGRGGAKPTPAREGRSAGDRGLARPTWLSPRRSACAAAELFVRRTARRAAVCRDRHGKGPHRPGWRARRAAPTRAVVAFRSEARAADHRVWRGGSRARRRRRAVRPSAQPDTVARLTASRDLSWRHGHAARALSPNNAGQDGP